MRKLILPCIGMAIALASCGGGSDSGSGLRQLGLTTAIPGVGTGTNFSFDLGVVLGNRYYVTDRNNASVDVFDTATSAFVTQIKGTGANAFAGLTSSTSTSGPDGINVVGNLLYVGDVNSVKVIDPALQQVVKTIVVGNTGKRADEGCTDSVHGLYMIGSPDVDIPFATFIDTKTQTVVAQVTFNDTTGAASGGLEQCRYDAATDAFYVNNDGSTDNPRGELDVIPGGSIRAIAPGTTVNFTALAGGKKYTLGKCDPTGLAIGPGNDIAVNCREGTAGEPLLVQILDKTNGAILASVNAGGGDQLEYDASSNRYYGASNRWTATGKAGVNGACSATSPCTPVLAVIDAATRTVVALLPSGNNAHSVAVDPVTGKAFLPASSGTSPGGCATCGTEPAELLTFATR